MKLISLSICMLVSIVLCLSLYAATDESNAIVAYIQSHRKTPATPLPEKLKTKAADILLLEDFVKDATLSLDKIPETIIERCKDLVFRESLLALIQALKIKVVSDDKTIETIIQKLNEKDVYTYLSAKIDLMLSNNDAFNATIKSASQEVKDFVLLDLLLTTVSKFGTMKNYQTSSEFKKNETFIKFTIDAGAKINTIISKLQTLGLSATEQETFISSLFAPHFDFIDFLLKNGLDKNLKLPVGQKEQTLLEFYENQLKDITDKVKNIESTELEDAQKETQKIIDLLKPKETKVAPETKPAKP